VPQSPDLDEAWLAARAEDEYPGDLEEYEDPDNAPPSGLDDGQLAALIAEAGPTSSGTPRTMSIMNCYAYRPPGR